MAHENQVFEKPAVNRSFRGGFFHYKVMKERKSVRVYDPNFKIATEEIKELLTMATSAPSSSNLQAWNFIVIQDQEVKKELRAIANN